MSDARKTRYAAPVQPTDSRPLTMQRSLTALLLTLAGCADSTVSSHDGGAQQSTPDSGSRVNERKVAIDLIRFATRDVTEGPDGEPAFGELEPLDGADVCIVQRREAFAVFKPFEPVEPPICTKSVAGEIARIEGAPANSDLLITVSYPGLRPSVLTSRTGDVDVPEPAPALNYSIPLLKKGVFDRWLEPEPAPAPGQGLVIVAAATSADPALVPSSAAFEPVELLLGTTIPGNRGTTEVDFTIRPAGAATAIELRSLERFRFMSLPAGSARCGYSTDNEHLACHPTGMVIPGTGELFGLPADLDALELPVLAGHDHWLGVDCTCLPGPHDGDLIDLASCRSAPGSTDEDAGAP